MAGGSSSDQGFRVSQLEALIAEHPEVEGNWLVYADAVSEVGPLPEFFKYALAGGRVPEPRFFKELWPLIERNELQVLFNRFHFIEAAWVRCASPDLAAHCIKLLTASPLSQFITQLALSIWSGAPAEPREQQLAAQMALKALSEGTAPLPALGEVSLGHAPVAVTLADSRSLLDRVRQRAPRLRTNPRGLVTAVWQVQLRLIRLAPGLTISGLAVGEVMTRAPQMIGVLAANAQYPDLHRIEAPQKLSGSAAFFADVQRHWLSLRVMTGPVILNNTTLSERASPVPLLEGDTVEIGPGAVFRVEAVEQVRRPETAGAPRAK